MTLEIRHVSALVLALTCALTGSADEPIFDGATCPRLLAEGPTIGQLKSCTSALESHPDETHLRRSLADAELKYGEPSRAAGLYQSILDRQGWNEELARMLALAQLRSGENNLAEEKLRQTVELAGSLVAHHDLVVFLLVSGRDGEALDQARISTSLFPTSCEAWSDQALCEAEIGAVKPAARSVRRSVEFGCHPFAWVEFGQLRHLTDHEAFADLLTPQRLTEGIEALQDDDVLLRLQLLASRVDASVAASVTDLILHREDLKIRLTGLGLITALGAEVQVQWQRLLASPDFVLQKQTLRRIHELDDVAFIPLLDEHLERDLTKGNRSLTRLALGQLLMRDGDPPRARALLEAIPDDDHLKPVALLELAAFAEKRTKWSEALKLIERAMILEPFLYIDQQRLNRLRAEDENLRDEDKAAERPLAPLKSAG